MAKISSQSDKARQPQALQGGIVKVEEAEFAVVQNHKADGTPIAPFFGMRFVLVQTDEEGNPTSDKTHEQSFPISWAHRDKENGGYLLEKMRFHPGHIESPDDDVAEDLGVKVGTTGNTIWGEEGSGLDKDCDWMEFCTSLESKDTNFIKINNQSFAPNYVGLVFRFTKANKPLKVGSKPTDKPQTRWQVEAVLVNPAVGAKKAKKAATTTTASKTNGQAVVANDTNLVTEGFQAAVDKLINSPAPTTQCITISKSLNGGKTVKITDFFKGVIGELGNTKINGKGLNGMTQKGISDGMKSEGFIEENNGGLLLVDREEGTISLA